MHIYMCEVIKEIQIVSKQLYRVVVLYCKIVNV